MVLFVARVNGFQLLTIVTKSSTLNATGSQNLLLNRVFDTAVTYLQCFFCHWRKILNTLICEFYSPSNDSSRNSYKTTIFFIFIQYWAPILSLCLFSFHEIEILKNVTSQGKGARSFCDNVWQRRDKAQKLPNFAWRQFWTASYYPFFTLKH